MENTKPLPLPTAGHYIEVYRTKADAYDHLVSAEDCQNNLTPALETVLGPLPSLRVAEVGAGTGRLTRLLVKAGATVHATDQSEAMLDVARASLQHIDTTGRWTLEPADARLLPMATDAFDAAVAGWVLGHFNSWFHDNWQQEISLALDEMQRVVRPGGTLVILETLGTGATTPTPPSEPLARYYAWLESKGWNRLEIATDYQFHNTEEAADICGQFFGADFATQVRQNNWSRVPEWTGLWHTQASADS